MSRGLFHSQFAKGIFRDEECQGCRKQGEGSWMENEICSEMLLRRWCFHLMDNVNRKFNVDWDYLQSFTSDIELQHLQPLLVHVEVKQYLLGGGLHIVSCSCNDRQICSLEQASGELETNATGGWRY